MTDRTLNRMLAIRAAAAGPYVVEGPCHDCGSARPLVNLLRDFMPSIAICRRCRETRTGVPDRRNMPRPPARATATIAEPEALAAPRIAGLLPATTERTHG